MSGKSAEFQRGKKKNKRIPRNIHIRSDGRWEIRVTYNDLDKKRQTYTELCGEDRSAKTIRNRVAEIKKEITLQREHPDVVAKVAKKIETVGKFLSSWLARQKLRLGARTIEDYEEDLSRLPSEITETLLAEFHHTMIESYFNELENQGKRWLVRRVFRTLRTAFNDGVMREELPSNPLNRIKPPKAEKQKHEGVLALTPEQAKKFLEAAQKNENGLIFEFALETGARPEEYLALRWDDVDLNSKTAMIRRALVKLRLSAGYQFGDVKTKNSRRQIRLSQRLTDKLKTHRQMQLKMIERRRSKEMKFEDLDLVFCTRYGSPIMPNNLARREFKEILKVAGLSDKFSPYSLRHTCATLLLLAGEHPKVVQERLGHSNISITMDIYSHVLPTMQRSATERLENLLYQ
jgi:integrase